MGYALLARTELSTNSMGNTVCSRLGNSSQSGTTEGGGQYKAYVAARLSKFAVRCNATGTGRTVNIRIDSANGNESVSMTDSTAGWYEDTSGNTDTLAASGTYIGIKNTSTGSPSIQIMRLLMQVTATYPHATLFTATSIGTVTTASTTWYVHPAGRGAKSTTTEDDVKAIMRVACTVRNAAVYVSSARATNCTVRSRPNKANGNFNITLTGGVTGWFVDDSSTDVLAAGDTFDWTLTTSTGSDNETLRGIDCTLTYASGQTCDIYSAWSAGIARSASGTDHFYEILGGGTNPETTRTTVEMQHGFPCKTTRARINVTANTYTGNATFALQKNAADGNQVVTITANTPGIYEDVSSSDNFEPTDTVNFRISGGTANSMTYTWMGLTEEDLASRDMGAGSLTLSGNAPNLDTGIIPSAGSLTLSGYAPSVSVGGGDIAITPGAGSLSLTGYAPSLDTGVVPGAGSLSLTGAAPSLDTAISPLAGSLTLTGFAPTRQVDLNLVPAAGSLTLAGVAPLINTGIAPASGALTITGPPPNLDTGITPGAGSLAVTGLAPSLDTNIKPGVGSLALTGYAPSIVVDIPISPAAGALALTGYAPKLDVGIIVPAASLALSGFEPSVGTGTMPGVGTLALTGYAPTVAVGANVTPDAGALALTNYAPKLDTGITVPAGALQLTGYVPSLGGAIDVTPGTGTLTLTGAAASLDTGITPPAGALTLIGAAPSIVLNIPLVPGAAALALTGYAPSLSIGIAPGAGTLTLAGYAPSAVIDRAITPGTGSVALTGYAPTLDVGILPPTGSLSLSGYTPSLGGNIQVTPGPAALSLSGYAPTVAVGANLQPGAGALQLAGYAPTLGVGITPGTGTLTLTGYGPDSKAIVAKPKLKASKTTLELSGTKITPTLDGEVDE